MKPKGRVFKNKVAHSKLNRPKNVKYYSTKKGTVSKIQTTSYFDTDWYKLSREIKESYNNKCAVCPSTKNLEVHHIIPLSRGGTNSKTNLICLCESCHNKRHKHLLKRR